ncbi:Asx homology domain-containing protein [Xylaria nigripes]|nr:Asx homology domain-containing protein [Xylaria nigripes]
MARKNSVPKAASADKAGAEGRPSQTTASKRKVKPSRARQRSITPGESNPTGGEIVVQIDAKRLRPNEVVPDELVVPEAPQKTNTEVDDPKGQSSEARESPGVSKLKRRSSRTSSLSQGGSSGTSPSGLGASIEKQDFGVVAPENDAKPDEPVSKKRKVDVKPTQRGAPRKSRSKWDSPDEMLTNPNAPLASAKLRDILCNPKAWDILTREETEQILAKFPDDAEILNPGTPNARPNIAALLNNNNFRHDVARYQEGLSKGFHDADWIRQAQAAHRSRQQGLFDDFMAVDFEEKWEMPMPKQPQAEPVAGESDNRQAEAVEGPYVTKPKSTFQHEYAGDVTMDQETEDQLKPQVIETQVKKPTEDQPKAQIPDAPVENPAEDTSKPHITGVPVENPTEDRRNNYKDANEGKVESTITKSKSENEERNRPLESDDKQVEQAEVKAVPMQDIVEPSEQKPEGPSNDIAAPTLPVMMEGVEHQGEEKTPRSANPKRRGSKKKTKASQHKLESTGNDTVAPALPDIMEGVEPHGEEEKPASAKTKRSEEKLEGISNDIAHSTLTDNVEGVERQGEEKQPAITKSRRRGNAKTKTSEPQLKGPQDTASSTMPEAMEGVQLQGEEKKSASTKTNKSGDAKAKTSEPKPEGSSNPADPVLADTMEDVERQVEDNKPSPTKTKRRGNAKTKASEPKLGGPTITASSALPDAKEGAQPQGEDNKPVSTKTKKSGGVKKKPSEQHLGDPVEGKVEPVVPLSKENVEHQGEDVKSAFTKTKRSGGAKKKPSEQKLEGPSNDTANSALPDTKEGEEHQAEDDKPASTKTKKSEGARKAKAPREKKVKTNIAVEVESTRQTRGSAQRSRKAKISGN